MNCLDAVRACADMARLDNCVQEFRTVQLTIRVIQWSGERVGSGSPEVVSELVMAKYQVRDIGSREILASGGALTRGDVRVRDISPPYTKSDGVSVGGYTLAQLDPRSQWVGPGYETPVRNREVEYVLAGETFGVYALKDIESDDITAWNLVLSLTRKTP